MEKEDKEIEYKLVEREKKSKWRKPVKVPVNYEDIDKWKMPKI